MKQEKTFEQILDTALTKSSIDDFTQEEHNVFMFITNVIDNRYKNIHNKSLDRLDGKGYSARNLTLPGRQIPVDTTLEGSRREFSGEST